MRNNHCVLFKPLYSQTTTYLPTYLPSSCFITMHKGLQTSLLTRCIPQTSPCLIPQPLPHLCSLHKSSGIWLASLFFPLLSWKVCEKCVWSQYWYFLWVWDINLLLNPQTWKASWTTTDIWIVADAVWYCCPCVLMFCNRRVNEVSLKSSL